MNYTRAKINWFGACNWKCGNARSIIIEEDCATGITMKYKFFNSRHRVAERQLTASPVIAMQILL